MKNDKNNCDCVYCKNNHEFNIGKELLEELVNGKVVIFAGAGVSTEPKTVVKNNFYELIAAEIEENGCKLPFPELMEKYCSGQVDGRSKLLKEIKNYFDFINSFPELVRSATRFHRELSTFFPIKNIITTNWDTYFEQFCNATPFVSDPDICFWEAAERRVLKIHGSLSNYSSIVATTADYNKCKSNLNDGVIGSFLKQILATERLIFVGYSFSDPDFLDIYNVVKSNMGSLHKQPYIVTPYSQDCERFSRDGFIPIRTDGTFFISQVKQHAIGQGLMLSDIVFDLAREALEKVIKEHSLLHSSMNVLEYPELIYAAYYQDGLIHSLERAITMKGSGQYSHSCNIKRWISIYEELNKERLSEGKFHDVAYIEGYINGLISFLQANDRKKLSELPMYFIFGVDSIIQDLNDFKKKLKFNTKPNEKAKKYASSMINSLNNPKKTEFHHPPWL